VLPFFFFVGPVENDVELLEQDGGDDGDVAFLFFVFFFIFFASSNFGMGLG
jgi:hypothetical protein